MNLKKMKIGRLAFREEGSEWIAYWAHPDTMELSMRIASIHIGLVQENEAARKAFVDCMQLAMMPLVKEASGVTPLWGDPKDAPERERGAKP